MDLPFRLLNVFGIEGDPFSGNPLAVFPGAAELSCAQMQSWARQLNLSETTFVTAVETKTRSAEVRIFTPSYEMPFAGHPTLGTAHVVAGLLAEGVSASRPDAVSLSMPAGRIPVRFDGQNWRLRANAPTFREAPLTGEALAATLGIATESFTAGGAKLVDVGVEQLIVQVVDAQTVRACAPDVALMLQHLGSAALSAQVYVWAKTGRSTVEARFFGASGGSLEEDPATGSACANLGGWLVGEGARGIRLEVSQGEAVGRPSRLVLTVDDDGGIHVAGRVIDVGTGTMHAG